MKACAEKHVIEALKAQQRQAGGADAVLVDEVSTALAVLTATDKCPGPNCGIPYEHNGKYGNLKVYTASCNAGGCAAMHCRSCKSHYCYWSSKPHTQPIGTTTPHEVKMQIGIHFQPYLLNPCEPSPRK